MLGLIWNERDVKSTYNHNLCTISRKPGAFIVCKENVMHIINVLNCIKLLNRVRILLSFPPCAVKILQIFPVCQTNPSNSLGKSCNKERYNAKASWKEWMDLQRGSGWVKVRSHHHQWWIWDLNRRLCRFPVQKHPGVRYKGHIG